MGYLPVICPEGFTQNGHGKNGGDSMITTPGTAHNRHENPGHACIRCRGTNAPHLKGEIPGENALLREIADRSPKVTPRRTLTAGAAGLLRRKAAFGNLKVHPNSLKQKGLIRIIHFVGNGKCFFQCIR